MKLLIESAMIFFGTLLAAGLVALGEPARRDRGAVKMETPAAQAVNQLLESARPRGEQAATPVELDR